MSFYRSMIATVAAMGLTVSAFAATAQPSAAKNPASAPAAIQVADAHKQVVTEKVNINSATAKELMQVKGMSAAKAKAIVSYRKAHGDFKTLDDLKNVKGFKRINEKKKQEIEDQLTI